MAQPAIFKIISVVLFFIIFSTAVGAASGEIVTGTGNDSTTGQIQPYSIKLFKPSLDSIHSSTILDVINGPNGEVLFATSLGLSTYDGTQWSTSRVTHNNLSLGLMDDYVTAIEFDNNSNLWIGYSGGLQIFNGRYYQVIRDQQILKDTRITDLQRWNDDMWIATGNAGIHRYRNGNWTWFQPYAPGGPGFYYATSMALDPESPNSLDIATDNEGLWIVKSPDDPVVFEKLAGMDDPAGLLDQVRQDPFGGVYFFNESMVVHYSTGSGFNQVLTTVNLSNVRLDINDIAASPSGKLYIATDDGIYIWMDNTVFRHIGGFEGIGSSPIVRTVNIDKFNRVWFSTPDVVGYYLDPADSGPLIPVEIVTATTIPTVSIPSLTVDITATPSPQITPQGSSTGILGPVLDPIESAINAITTYFGFKLFSL
jgi:hypothetical protein